MTINNKILIVEDEEHIRKFVRINLERNGFVVLEADTGEKGIDIARTESIDVVVLDIMLPGIDGFEYVKYYGKSYQG